jgi:regulator of sigma E protease
MLAGVTMNILLAVVMYFIVIANSGWEMVLDWSFENFQPTGATITREVVGNVSYTSLVDGGNAQKANIPSSGEIKTIDGTEVKYSEDVPKLLKSDISGISHVEICNDTCAVYEIPVSDKGTIGVVLPTNYYVIISYKDNKITAGFSHLINTVRLVGMKFGTLFSQAKTTGDYSELSNSISGPVGIYFLINYFKGLGTISFLSMIGDLSLSLAIMNILPIPALDGGRVLILAIEGILGRELDDKVKTIIINGSFIFLMLLVILIMVKDVLNIQNIKDMFK